ncbi:MAG: Cof-type HAD-IIB family hydrolase [Bacilli bacterium]
MKLSNIGNQGMLSNQTFLIVLDLDGTLLKDDKTISKETILYLQELQRRGQHIAIASGRPERAILPYYRQLGLKGPLIAYNGILVKDPDPKSSFPSICHRFKREYIDDLLTSFPDETFANIITEDGEDIYFLRHEEEFEKFYHADMMKTHYGPIKGKMKKDPFCFILKTKDRKRDSEISDLVSSFPDIGIRFWWDYPDTGEFFFYSKNKATGIEELSKIYGIDRAHIMAFGDAENDVEMLSRAGISFAMKNGAQSLKNICSYVSLDDNEHDGVRKSLEKIFG